MYGLSLIVIIEWVPMDIATFCWEEVCLRNLMGEETNHHTETGKRKSQGFSKGFSKVFKMIMVKSKTLGKIETANAIFWIYLGGTA